MTDNFSFLEQLAVSDVILERWSGRSLGNGKRGRCLLGLSDDCSITRVVLLH